MSDNIKPNYAYLERKMKLIADELTLRTYTSEELAREFARLARTASEAAAVGEFKEDIELARREAVEPYRKDAERYQWLCDVATEGQWVEFGGYTVKRFVDQSIDAARASSDAKLAAKERSNDN